MEKRIGTITILIEDRTQSVEVNRIISEYADLMLCRQGFPMHDRPVAIITLIVEGEPDRINALTGQLGRVEGVHSKALLVKA